MDKNNIAVWLIKQVKYFNNPYALDTIKDELNKVRKGSLAKKFMDWCEFQQLTCSIEQATMIADYLTGKYQQRNRHECLRNRGSGKIPFLLIRRCHVHPIKGCSISIALSKAC